MEPVFPFEPVVGDSIPGGDQWRYEIKWDGTRILTYRDGGLTQLFNRKKRERTHHYPELLDTGSYCDADSVILDGEVIALAADGKPSFHDVMRRDLIRRLERVKEVRQAVPVTYMIFDILFYNGKWVHDRPLSDRLELLHGIVRPNAGVQLVSAHPSGEALFDVMRQQSMEGVVCKDLSSTYAFGGKDDRWKKVKNYGDTVAVIGGYTLNGGFVNSVLLGQYDREDKLRYIGHSGTGKLTKAEWRDLTGLLKPITVQKCTFAKAPEHYKDAFWVKPEFTVKVQYSDWRWQEGRKLRHPSLQAFVNAEPETCRLPW